MEKRREEKNMGTIKYPIFGVCIAFMFLGAFAGVVSAKTIYVQ